MIFQRMGLCLFLVASIIFVVLAECSFAEVKSITLPGDYADFAMHPKTGDIVALDAEKGQAIRFRNGDLTKETLEPADTLRVGSTPVSIFYKEFGGKQFYAVVCSQDTHMYVINAADFSLVAKIELSQGGVSYVTGSQNKEDPFLYYNFGSGHGSTAGAVSLRDMKNKGLAFNDSMDCAISASGEIAYRRGPWSPSGFESLIRTSEVNAEKPTFARLFYDHTSTAQYLPDPFDQYTAAGTKIYTRSLEKNIAELDFVPLVYFSDRPVIIGMNTTRRSYSSRDPAPSVTLKAASYNTFSSIGDDVKLPPAKSVGDGALPRGIRSQANYKRVTKRQRIFADEARNRVVYASRNGISLVPLEDFNLPAEPFLLADLQGSDSVLVGEECKLTLVPRDKDVEVVIEDIPVGMKRDGMKLTWTPETVGVTTMAVTLKHGDIQRSLKFDLDVAYPYTTLPFAPNAIAIDEEGKRAVIWEGPAKIDLRLSSNSTPAEVPAASRIAVIELASGKVKAERQIASRQGRGLLDKSNVILWNPYSSPKIEILNANDLERSKSLVTGGPIAHVNIVGDLLVVNTTKELEFYDSKTFAKRGTFAIGSNSSIRRGEGLKFLSPHGFYVRNVLYGFDLKPKLLLSANGLPSLVSHSNFGINTSALELFSPATSNNAHTSFGSRDGTLRLGQEKVTGSDTVLQLDQSTARVQVPGSIHTWRTKRELTIRATGGGLSERQVLVSKNLHSQTSSTPATATPLLKASKTKGCVVDGTRLYQWDIPTGEATSDDTTAELHMTPTQTALTLSNGKTTVLKHSSQGGKSPVKYSLLIPYEGITIDEKTGDVTIDNAKLREEALAKIISGVRQSYRGGTYVETLRAQAVKMVENATPLLGRRPSGAPVAIPIRVEASDANLANSSLQYYLIAEIPSKTILANLAKLDEERTTKMADEAARLAAAKAAGGSERSAEMQDTKELERRIESLENRVDLMTRQLNILIKKLDEK